MTVVKFIAVFMAASITAAVSCALVLRLEPTGWNTFGVALILIPGMFIGAIISVRR